MQKRKRPPVWRPNLSSRVRAFLRKHATKQVTRNRVIAVLSLVVVALCVYVGASANLIVIEPFSVPKRYEDAGLTSEVMARLVADALAHLEDQAHSLTRKESFVLASDPSPIPDVEVPGIKVKLRTIVEAALHIFERDPTHVRGSIVLPITTSGSQSAVSEVEITVAIVRGRDRGLPLEVRGPSDDQHVLAQKTAE